MPKPLVTAVVATYNEERHIEKCLRDLLAQDGLAGEVEILVIDGGSDDRTVELVQRFADQGHPVQLLHNSKRLQVHAWNMGGWAANGKYVTLISAHTEYSSDYLVNCIEALESTGAANVGGIQVPVGDGAVGSVIAWAMQSPFAIGNGRFRYARTPEFVDHVFTIFLKRETLLAIGGYDESFAVNEDCEFDYRLRKAGHTIYCTPAIRVRYHARPSIPRLARQMYRYGYWRRRTQLRHPEYVPLRVLAPPLLVLGLVLSVVLFATTRWLPALALPLVYAGFLVLAAGTAAAKLKNPLALLIAPAVLAAMHVSYGSGWWNGFFHHRKKHVLQWPAALSGTQTNIGAHAAVEP